MEDLYILVSTENINVQLHPLNVLQELVNKRMLEGYRPLGAPIITVYASGNERWVQAMVWDGYV